jgi:hypothetical protein
MNTLMQENVGSDGGNDGGNSDGGGSDW